MFRWDLISSSGQTRAFNLTFFNPYYCKKEKKTVKKKITASAGKRTWITHFAQISNEVTNKRPGCLIFRSNKETFQSPSVLCTPPFEKSPTKAHRFCVLPPLKNHPSKPIGFVYSPLWKNDCFWWAFISANTGNYVWKWNKFTRRLFWNWKKSKISVTGFLNRRCHFKIVISGFDLCRLLKRM